MGEVCTASLWVLPSRFVVANDVKTKAMTIDRSNYRMEMEDDAGIPVGTQRLPIAGIAGIIQLVSGPHLVVINKKEKVGHLGSENHAVWRVATSSLIPFSTSKLHLTPDERKLDLKQSQMVEDLLKEKHFYFSYTYDLTSNQQRINSVFCQQTSPIASFNTQFAWNYNILRPFCAKLDFLAFCVALVHGAIFINNCSVNGKYFRWTIISRRSNRRAGTRFFRRGADASGAVANFVETEQVVEHGENVASFVQTRGSMPVFWSQEPNLRYMPKPWVDPTRDSAAAFRAHFQDQSSVYGSQMVINLINQTRDEGRLETALRNLHKDSGMGEHVGYEAFDFHRECANMRWDRLALLVGRMRNCMANFGCFVKAKSVNGHIAAQNSQQSGVFRTNCMDCLDRTNVVQSLLANENLDRVLRDFGLLREGVTTHSFPDFQRLFRHVWADHANLLALQYAGSGALKTDFTRTGKRTVRGALEDLGHAIMRYWKNNFCDGHKQDAIDLFLGTCTETSVKAMVNEPLKKWMYLPLFLLGDVSLLLLTVLLGGEFEASHHLWVIFLLSVATLLVCIILRKAQVFVDQPKFTAPSSAFRPF